MSDEPGSVLVVDDNPDDRALLETHLSREGYEVECAEDGVEALRLLETAGAHFDVILCDRMMPRMGGVPLLQTLKSHPDLKSVPVILQTASDSRADLIEAMRAGAFYYLTKPIDTEMLLSVVETAVRDRHSYRELQTMARRVATANRLLRAAQFSLSTIEEAKDVGSLIAALCPDPQNVVIGLTELIVNAVEHGNLGVTYDEKTELNESGRWAEEIQRRLQLPENLLKRVSVTFERDDHEIRITVIDEGAGFDWNRYVDPDPSRAFDNHGRGIVIARRVSFAELEYRGNGNEVIGHIRIGPKTNGNGVPGFQSRVTR
ncbi:MAG TPA: response regulator [Thermoanaerobaculia bacterium]